MGSKNSQSIEIDRVLRRMRGGSQSYLVQGRDQRFYVAKFAGNPQGTRTLVNEWVASKIFRQFEISTPDLTILRLDPATKVDGQAPCFEVAGRRIPIKAGLHLGSLCPVNPDRMAIYDFLPENMLRKTSNLSDFAKALVLDLFLSQSDSRQAIFIRERSTRELSFRAFMIDYGMLFGGNKWELADLVGQGLYFDRRIYSMLKTASLCEQTLASLAKITAEHFHAAAEDIPSTWLAPGDFDALARLFTLLQKRQNRLTLMVSQQLKALRLDADLDLNSAVERGSRSALRLALVPEIS